MPKPLPARKETLGQRAYYELRRRILSGELAPGERLPLRTVASSLGMSIAPVGEALRDLSHDGLIEMESGWGARVRKLDLDDLRNQHVLRTAVECESIRYTAERALDGQVDDLAKLAQDTDACIDGRGAPEDVQELDSAFHLGVARLSGCAVLVETLESNQIVRLLARGSILAQDREVPVRQHTKIVEAIRTRDADTAERVMREHCMHSMDLQLRYMI